MTRSRIVLCLALLSLAPAAAEAQQESAVVLSFSGPRGEAARGAVVSALSDRVSLERRSDAQDIAGRLGVQLTSPQGMAAVAQELGVTLVVRGRVRGGGRRARVEVTYYDAEGERVATVDTGPPVGRRGRRAFRQSVLEGLDDALQAAREKEAERRAAEQRAAAAPAPAPAPAPEPEAEEPREPGETPVAALYVGIAGRTRDATLRLESGMRRIYDSGMFPEISLLGELRPFASDDSALAGLYAEIGAAFSVGLSSNDQGSGEDVDTNAYRLRLLVGYMLGIADGAAELGLTFGFVHDAFKLGDNPVMPSAKYPQLRLGLRAQVDVVQDLFWIRADGGPRFVLGTSELDDAFGSNASALGWDVGASLGGAIDAGFAYALRLSFRRYNLDFGGMAADAPATGGEDDSLALTLHLGWEIR